MDCPICQYKGLDSDAEVCPSCKTDLKAFKAMNILESSYKRQKFTLFIFIVLFFIAVVACLMLYLYKPAVERPVTNDSKLVTCENTIKTLQAENQKLKSDIAELKAKQAEILSVEKPVEPKIQTHVVKEGETLYLIATKYFNDGKRYKKIAADNNLSDPNVIVPGQELIIKQ
jgi:LysM repeat protein